MSKHFAWRYLFAISAMFVLVSAPALALEGSPVSWGLKAGLNYSSLRGDVPDEVDPKVGFSGGAFLAYAFNDWFTVQPELLYSQKGAEATWQEAGGESKFTFSLDYLEIPLLAVLTIPTQSRVTPKIFAGPALGFLVRAEEKLEEGGRTRTRDVRDDLRAYEVGIVFGLGLDIGAGTGAITADIRYNMGLTSIDEDVGSASDNSVRNGVFSFMLGYAF